MGARDRYASAAAFRAALEHRLRLEAQGTGLTLQRLRKEAVYHRLLYRLQRAAPDSWAIKGGFALILRLGEQARAIRDVDANWRATTTALEDSLSAVEEIDDGDWFTFDIGDARTLEGEGEDGAYRYAVTATLDSRVFEQLILDVNVVGEHDPRPVEVVTVKSESADARGTRVPLGPCGRITVPTWLVHHELRARPRCTPTRPRVRPRLATG